MTDITFSENLRWNALKTCRSRFSNQWTFILPSLVVGGTLFSLKNYLLLFSVFTDRGQKFPHTLFSVFSKNTLPLKEGTESGVVPLKENIESTVTLMRIKRRVSLILTKTYFLFILSVFQLLRGETKRDTI